MTQNIPQNINPVPGNVDLKTLLDYWTKQIKLDFNCHDIGTIQSFDPLTQTAQVTINYTDPSQQISSVGQTTITSQNYPVLVDCPCIVMGGGGGYLSFPIEAGDECLVLFNDRDMDNWFAGTTGAPPATGRLHAFADAIALVGLRSLANVITNYPQNGSQFFYKGKTVTLYEDRVEVDVSPSSSPGTVTLALYQDGTLAITNPNGEFVSSACNLFQAIEDATVNTVFGPQKLIMPLFATYFQIFKSFLG